MFSLLQQTAPVVVEHSETVVSTETAQVAAHGADAAHVATAADAEIAARSAESEKRIGEIRATAVEDARAVARDVTESLVQNFGGSVDQNLINDAVDQRLKGALQ